MIIVIEGIDGSGKSTQARRLAAARGWKLQAFPDRTTPVGLLIHQVLSGKLALGWNPCTGNHDELRFASESEEAVMLQALMVVNRAERWCELAGPSRARDHHLVLDRYYQSGLTYGAADGLDREWLHLIHGWLPRAELNVLIRASPEVCAARMKTRGAPPERYDDLEKLERVADEYDAIWLEGRSVDEPLGLRRWVVVDGTRSEDEVAALIGGVVNDTLETLEGR